MTEHEAIQSEATQTEILTIHEAYAEKINTAIAAGDDRRAIDLSAQFRDEAFAALSAAAGRRVA